MDEGLVDACGTNPSWLCEATWNVTNSGFVARFVDGVVAPVLLALIVLIVAALLNRWLRRLVTTAITQVTRKDRGPGAALDKLVTGSESADAAREARDRARAATLSTVARTTVSAVIWTCATLVILGIFAIDLGPLIASAGIAGIAVAFGAQALVKDCISGFFILLEDQCAVGDEIDIGPAIGTVEGITLRTTTVRDGTGTLWVVPNGTVMRIGNRSRQWSQGTVDVTIAYAAQLDDAQAVIERVAGEVSTQREVAAVLDQPIDVLGVENFDTAGAVVRAAVRTAPGKQAGVMRTLRAAIKRELDAADIAWHG